MTSLPKDLWLGLLICFLGACAEFFRRAMVLMLAPDEAREARPSSASKGGRCE